MEIIEIIFAVFFSLIGFIITVFWAFLLLLATFVQMMILILLLLMAGVVSITEAVRDFFAYITTR